MENELEFSIKNTIGQTISGVVYMPEEISEPKPIVIFSHGYAANYKRVEGHCKYLASKGYPAIAFDFRGGGAESKSDGKQSEMTIETEIMDLKCVIQFAKKLAIADHDRIYVMGESLGGLVTLLTVTDKDIDVRGVALWSPALMIPEDSKKRLNNEPLERKPIEVSDWFDEVSASIDIMKRIKGLKTPVIMFWGEKDTIVPKEMLEEACANMEDAKLVTLPGQGHRFDDETADRVCDMSREFFAERLIKELRSKK